MSIRIAISDDDVQACYPVMWELRPQLKAEQFLDRVREQERCGYHLAWNETETGVVAVAGFRLGTNLSWGRFLYVDDLVTHAKYRSKGYGTEMLTWLKAYAVQEDSVQIHLDSGTEKVDAHRFYEREGLTKKGYQFFENIK